MRKREHSRKEQYRRGKVWRSQALGVGGKGTFRLNNFRQEREKGSSSQHLYGALSSLQQSCEIFSIQYYGWERLRLRRSSLPSTTLSVHGRGEKQEESGFAAQPLGPCALKCRHQCHGVTTKTLLSVFFLQCGRVDLCLML